MSSMTIKTPEQIADELQNNLPLTTTERQAMIAAIEADRAQRPEPVVVIRDGCAYETPGVEVIDLDFLGYYSVTAHSDFSQEDIDRMLATLAGAGFESSAEDVREWWADK